MNDPCRGVLQSCKYEYRQCSLHNALGRNSLVSMSDPVERDRYGRRRRRRERFSEQVEREMDPSPSPKPPIILGAKPVNVPGSDGSTSSTNNTFAVPPTGGSASTTTPAAAKPSEKPVLVLRQRDENKPSTTPMTASTTSSSAASGDPAATQNPYQIQRHPTMTQMMFDSNPQARLAAPPEMKHSTKLVDDSSRWIDSGIEYLIEQTDFMVVGVIGGQGVGKSTILSLLGGNSPQDAYRSYIFCPQTKEIREDGSHQTNGIDMFVSPERIIFLDAQAVLSPSVLDNIIRFEKKFPMDFTTTENFVEMQSLQIASFMMTVCHVVLVVQDWFEDYRFLKFMQTAEMLKPASASYEGSSSQEDIPNYYPHVVFIQNKAGRDNFSPSSFRAMQKTLASVFGASKLKFRDDVHLQHLPADSDPTADINLFLLPYMEYYKSEQDPLVYVLPEYRGYPSFLSLLKSLRSQMYSMPREQLTQNPLSEKSWFMFAARIWDSVKKSPLMSEYNRLLG